MTTTDPNIDTFDFYIYPREVGAAKRILLHNLGACILDAAGLSAARRGFGMNDMHARGRAWVVSRMMMKIAKWPHEYETVKISTWVSAIGRVASTRLFAIEDLDGNLMATASTLWSIIDTTTRHMVDLIETTDLSQYKTTHPSIGVQTPHRIEIPRHLEAPTIESSHAVVYTDIDMNRHVNSMKYLQWAIDSIPIDYLLTHAPTECHINFTHEALPHQTIAINRYDIDENNHLFDLKNTQGRTCCRISLTYDA